MIEVLVDVDTAIDEDTLVILVPLGAGDLFTRRSEVIGQASAIGRRGDILDIGIGHDHLAAARPIDGGPPQADRTVDELWKEQDRCRSAVVAELDE